MKHNIAIATMTLDTKGDAQLMEAALEVLAIKSYTVYVADGGSSERFLASIKKMGHKVTYVPGGLTNQHKHSILRASSTHDIVLYTEPDKFDWFVDALDATVDQYFAGVPSGFAAVGRSREALQTYPVHQQKWEGMINKAIVEKLGLRTTIRDDYDFVYGPKLFPTTLGRHVADINGNIGWGTLMFLVGRAHKNHMMIRDIPSGLPCPQSQRTEDNEAYRKTQFADNYAGFQLGLK